MQNWVNLPPTFLSKKDKLIVTIYGPYGIWLKKLRKICEYLRKIHGFLDSLPVKDRQGFRKMRQGEIEQIFEMKKSYHFLDMSHVNVFVFYCMAHGQSVDFELKELLDKLPHKIRNSIVLRDSSCEMGRLFEGEVINAKIRYETFDGQSRKPQREISDIVNAYCLNILKRDYYQI